MRKLIPFTIVVSLFAVLASSSSVALDINKYVWPPVMNSLEQQQGPLLGYGISIVDDFTQGTAGGFESHSFISVSGKLQPLCAGFMDPVCTTEISAGRGKWWSNISFAPCKTNNELSACIEAVRLGNPDGTYRDLKLKKIIPGNPWPADPSIGLPEGSAPGLWVDPNETDPNKGFLVAASGSLLPSGSKVSGVTLRSFQSSISPYELILEPKTRGMYVTNLNGVRKLSFSAGSHCIWADEGECGVQSEFSPNARLQLVLHLPSRISSWLIGRLRKPEISVENLSNIDNSPSDISRVAISAESIEVPMISAKVDLANMSDAQRNYFNDPQHNSGNANFPDNLHGYSVGNTASSYELAFEMYELFKDQWPKNAQVMYPRWSVRSLLGTTGDASICNDATSGKLQGLVTTNASIYQGAPPTFDGETFDYRVAGVHNKTNGDVFQGSYDLVLDSKFARCLYKFTTAPIKASVTITNANGNSSAVTSTFTEKYGWIKMSVNGFTFSNPKISIKLSQEKAAKIVIPSSKAKNATKKITLICIKGKIVKKVTALNPKCPTGYKKK